MRIRRASLSLIRRGCRKRNFHANPYPPSLNSVQHVEKAFSFLPCFRHFKLEAEIASMTWKVHWNDIIFVPNAKTRGSMFSLIANKMRGSQLVNEKCYAPLCDKTAAMKFKKRKCFQSILDNYQLIQLLQTFSQVYNSFSPPYFSSFFF